ncbi:hypothetical protein [Nocardia sp. NPDC050406]|uniref:hypothetical protein n=1 Tax=Nocardia sp. NPDC050406 TaxID=3364318 RepID=UPI0037B4D0EF
MGATTGRDHWVHDDCEKGFVFPISRRRAEGIVSIHASCEPPCPRKQAASEFLDDMLSSANPE